MFPHGLEARCRKVLDGLLEYEVGSPAQDYSRDQVTGTPASKIAAPPPPGMNLGVDGEFCPPISASPYAHFTWQFANADTEDRALGILHAAERLLRRLLNPIEMADLTEDSKTLALQGARSGEEIAEIILVNYVEYDSDTVDMIEGLKPGTTRRVRGSNLLDDLGHPKKGVPKWLYWEFEVLDQMGGKDAVMQRFQIASSTYYDIKAKIRKMRDEDDAPAQSDAA